MARLFSGRRGAALLISLAVLVILSILAVSFVKLANQERNAGENYTHNVRARMAAQSGLNMASGRVVDYFRAAIVDDWTNTPWAYGDNAAVSLPWAAAPSYTLGTMAIGGTNRGYSGLVFSPAQDQGWLPPAVDTTRGIHFALRITDMNTRININDPNPRMATMLDNLGVGIAAYDGQPDPVLGAGGGAAIIAVRNAQANQRFYSVYDLMQVPNMTPARLELLSNYIAVESWTDNSVVAPSPQSSWTNQSFAFTTTSRSPINVNLAPRAVLYACLRGLSGRAFLRTSASSGYWAWGNKTLPDAQATTIVNAIHTERQARPIKSYYHLSTLIATTYRSLVMANLDPNARTIKFNPDLVLSSYGTVESGQTAKADLMDKTDLTYHTTEFCFISHGFMQIESLGRVVDRGGNVLSLHHLAQAQQVFEVIKHTTQSDFETNRVSSIETKSYPESMADQAGDLSKATTFDGQIALQDITYANDPRQGSIIWHADYEDHQLGPDRFRWRNSWIDWPAYYMREPYENLPIMGLPSPGTRQMMGTTTLTASNLYPDGGYFSETVGTMNRYGNIRKNTYGGTGQPNLNPAQGTMDFWFKPDCRAYPISYAAKGVCAWLLFGPGATIPASTYSYTEMYLKIAVSSWLNGGGGDVGVRIAGTVSWRARKAQNGSIPNYPYGNPYFILTYPNWITSLRGNEWNHVRFSWSNYMIWRAYFNGSLVGSANGYLSGGTTLNWNRVVDVLMAGFRHMPKPWNGAWSNPATGTIDQIRTFGIPDFSGSIPDHYNLTNGDSRWIGNLTFASPGGPVRALTMRFDTSPGHGPNNVNNASLVRVAYRLGGATSAAIRGDDVNVPPGHAIDQTFDPSAGLEYHALFYDNNQAPFMQTPYFDSVTLFYRLPEGTAVLRQWAVQS